MCVSKTWFENREVFKLLTFNELLKLWFPGLRDQWFFEQDLIYQPVYISSIVIKTRLDKLIQIIVWFLHIFKDRGHRKGWLRGGSSWYQPDNGCSINTDTYVGVRLSRSIDLVSISPLLFRYSRMIPGGWNRSKNLFNFMFDIQFLFKLLIVYNI